MGRLSDRWTRPVLLAACVLLTGGCATPATAPAQKDRTVRPGWPPPPQTPPGTDKRFIIAPELTNILHVVNVRLNHPPESYLKIQITVQNMTATRQQFSYHIDWFDEDGAMLKAESEEFTPWMLLPNEVASIAVAAPLPTAADFGIAFLPAVK